MTSPTSSKFGPPLVGTYPVSSGYGDRDGTLHAGIDYAAPAGTQIIAAYGGKVVEAGLNDGWGNTVLIDHGVVDGEHVYTRYAHMIATPSVKVGQTVATGAPLGRVGSTGDSTGNHLHFGEYIGDAATNATSVNPATSAIKPGTLTGAATDPAGFGLEDVPGIGPFLAAGVKAFNEFVGYAKLGETILTSVTKLFLPNNLLRGAAGALGLIMLCFSLWFLGRELRS